MNKKEKKRHFFYKPNSLINSKYSLTVVQNRIMNQLLFETDLLKEFKLKDGIPSVYELKLSYYNLKNIFNESESSNDMLNTLKKISKADIFFYKKKDEYIPLKLISSIHLDKRSLIFSIFMYSEIYYIIKDTSMGYTPIDIEVLHSLKSFYSERLYELLRSWSGTKEEIKFKVDELKEIFLVSNRYERYNDFKRKCINKAINEINQKGYMSIEMEEIKLGRKIETLNFKVKDLIPRSRKK